MWDNRVPRCEDATQILAVIARMSREPGRAKHAGPGCPGSPKRSLIRVRAGASTYRSRANSVAEPCYLDPRCYPANIMGKLAEIKTKPTASSVEDFIAKVPDEQKRKDCLVLLKLMEKASKEKPRMWGAAMIGFGQMRYK